MNPKSNGTMKVVYVAGPYRADTELGVHQNIQAAERVALEVWKLGAVCLCPQKNTAYFGGVLPDSVWLEGDLELVRRSDAVLMIPGWEDSEGAKSEKVFAEECRIPVLESLDELKSGWRARGGRDRGVGQISPVPTVPDPRLKIRVAGFPG